MTLVARVLASSVSGPPTAVPDAGWSLDGEVAAIFFVTAALLGWAAARRAVARRRAWPWLLGAAFCAWCGVQPARDALHEAGGWFPSAGQIFITLQLVGIGLIVTGIVRRKQPGALALVVAGLSLVTVLWMVAIGFVLVGLGRLHG